MATVTVEMMSARGSVSRPSEGNSSGSTADSARPVAMFRAKITTKPIAIAAMLRPVRVLLALREEKWCGGSAGSDARPPLPGQVFRGGPPPAQRWVLQRHEAPRSELRYPQPDGVIAWRGCGGGGQRTQVQEVDPVPL